MTRPLFVRTVVACMFAVTFVTAVAQAQSPSDAAAKFEVGEGAAGDAAALGVAEFVDPSRFFGGVCTIGPRGGDVLFRCYGLGFSNPNPALVHCQTRNHPTEAINWPDQFGCQVIATSTLDNGSVWVRIRRLDDGTNASGWGQNLQINLWIVN